MHFIFSCNNPRSGKSKNVEKPHSQAYDDDSDEDFDEKRVDKKKKKKQVPEDDPYIADDEDEDFNGKQRRSVNDDSRLVMKVVKQGDYQHKQSYDRRSGGLGDIEQDFFLPRNLTLFNKLMSNSTVKPKAGSKSRRQVASDEEESWQEELDDVYEDYDGENGNMTKTGDRAKTKAVFEMPRKPPANYSKWSRWSKCSPKCVTRRYKKCRLHARLSCGNDIIREIAYCYTEGSFCEEWISSQISKLGSYNTIETPKTTTTTKAPKVTRRTESPLVNSVSQNFYGSNTNSGSKRKNKMNPLFKPQNFQCGFPSIRNKNNDFALKIIGGKTSRRAQV